LLASSLASLQVFGWLARLLFPSPFLKGFSVGETKNRLARPAGSLRLSYYPGSLRSPGECKKTLSCVAFAETKATLGICQQFLQGKFHF